MENIDKLFFGFDVKQVKSHDYMYFYDGLGKWGARGRLTKSQLKELHYNISVMENICRQYGSMDKYLSSMPVYQIILDLSDAKSPHKLKRMGEALVCEYLRNVGVDCFKPDVHLQRMLGPERLCASAKPNPSFADLYQIMQRLSTETGLWMGQIDYILWAYCADNYGEICTATPKCSKCVLANICHKN